MCRDNRAQLGNLFILHEPLSEKIYPPGTHFAACFRLIAFLFSIRVLRYGALCCTKVLRLSRLQRDLRTFDNKSRHFVIFESDRYNRKYDALNCVCTTGRPCRQGALKVQRSLP